VQVIRGLADELLDRLVKLDGLNAPHLTIADGIAAQAFDISVYIVDIAPQIGIRETRRIVGAYQLTEDDVLGCADFGDTIGVNGWPVEAHVAGTVEFRWQTKARGFNQLPFRMILPGTVANLYVTGRCASMTHGAQSAARVHRPLLRHGRGAGRRQDRRHRAAAPPGRPGRLPGPHHPRGDPLRGPREIHGASVALVTETPWIYLWCRPIAHVPPAYQALGCGRSQAPV